jgi:hypothetical protein
LTISNMFLGRLGLVNHKYLIDYQRLEVSISCLR